MNKNILFVLPFGWFFTGCVAQTAPAPLTCTTYTESACDGQKNNPLVTINLDTKVITPECVNAKKGRVIIFELESTTEITKDTVEVLPRSGDDGWWLAGKNSPNKKRILVLAPKKKEDGSNFPTGKRKYKIITPDWCIDPRVNVEN